MHAIMMLAVLAAAFPEDAAPPPTSQRCGALLGDAASVARNRDHRLAVIETLDASDEDVTLIHSGDWDDATALSLVGVTLVAVDPVEHTATLDVDIDGVCDGAIEVEVDESIGANVQVLAVTPHAVLVEREGELRYLPLGDVDIDVVWRASYTVVRPTRASPARKVPPRRR